MSSSHLLDCASVSDVFMHLDDPLLGGIGVVFLSVIWPLARQIYLETLVQIGYVVPGLLPCLTPGDSMILDEGIMARICATHCQRCSL
jgi:hypothetical protein